MIIDLRSDTVTLPTKEMKAAMFNAKVGDDVFEDDQTVNSLEELSANLFEKEAAIFCPSGTMTNQIAIKIKTNSPGEIICDELSHIYQYEGGGIGFNSGMATKLLQGNLGRLNAEQIEAAINPDNVHFPSSQLVCLENTCNKGGGTIYDFNEIKKIKTLCDKKTLPLHLDGARIFNAIIESNYTTKDLGQIFDTISICLSKGLGAPVGSLLLGTKEDIKKARRIRKILGGGMRQAGYMAAAGIYALENNLTRLKEDHKKAEILGDELKKLSYVEKVSSTTTNIVVFKIIDKIAASLVIEKLAEKNILVVPFGHQQIRMVTHMDFTDNMLTETIRILKSLTTSF